ncbi:CopG family transcriptional regulator [Leucobacter sp. W1038]|uniref:ribbon-helix-helix domain-containing protein n=1 Tax=Leucobacter sp. W1038 TaxID=3438281 RepID=UPI003D95BA00
MKTTLNLPDALLEAVKRRAADEGRTQSSVIEVAIRLLLSEGPPPAHRPMPTYGEAGRNSLLVDLEDEDAPNSVLDDEAAA